MNHMHIITEIRDLLESEGDESLRASGKKFFKESVNLYGVKTARVIQIAKEKRKALQGIPKTELFMLCGELWQSGMLEEAFIACNWSETVQKEYAQGDFDIFERWVNQYVTNWATCDTLCNHTVGSFVMAFPDTIEKLKEWALSPNRWTRRAAAVSLIIPARKGLFRNEIFEIATILLKDTDDMVRKGYGWMLKAASEANQREVFDFVIRHKKVMPRTALRYAIEKMPPEMKAKAMAK
jgi:3-methyladenine DNA glycosylase AlkD